MAQDLFHTTHNYVVTVAEWPGIKFASLTGGNMTAEGVKVTPGGSELARNVDGQSMVNAITLIKPADDLEDVRIKAWASAWRRGQRLKLTVIKTRVTPSGVPVPGVPPLVYLRCSLRDYTPPNVERGTTNAANLSITLDPEDMKE